MKQSLKDYLAAFPLKDFPLRDYLAMFLAGVLATVVGIALANILETQERDTTALSEAREELLANATTLTSNQELLRQDLAAIARRQTIILPLGLVKNSSLDALKVRVASLRMNDEEILDQIRDVSISLNRLNENILGRQHHQTYYVGVHNYYSVLKTYDEMLLQQHEILKKTMDDLAQRSSQKIGPQFERASVDQISLIGLTLDIFGALFLAKGFITKQTIDVRKDATAGWNWNQDTRESVIRQRVEVWIGGVALTLGFFVQSIPYVFRVSHKTVLLIALASGFALLWLALTYISRHVEDQIIDKLDRTELLGLMEEFEKNNNGRVSPELDRWGKLAKLLRRADESDSDFQTRLKSYLAQQPRYGP
jgi:hypothetical protein